VAILTPNTPPNKPLHRAVQLGSDGSLLEAFRVLLEASERRPQRRTRTATSPTLWRPTVRSSGRETATKLPSPMCAPLSSSTSRRSASPPWNRNHPRSSVRRRRDQRWMTARFPVDAPRAKVIAALQALGLRLHDHPRHSGAGEPRMRLPPGAPAAALPAGSPPRRRRSPRAALPGGGADPVEKAASSTFSSCPAVRGPAAAGGREGRPLPEGNTAFPPCTFSGRGSLARAPRRALRAARLRRPRGLVFREARPRKAVVAAPA